MFIGGDPPKGVVVKRGPNGQVEQQKQTKEPRRTEPDETGARGYIIERDSTGKAKAWNA